MAGLSPARKAAYNALVTARERDAYVRELLNADASPLAKLSPEDRAYAKRLALGVTAARGTLDEAVDRFASKPEKLDPAVRDALRLGAYELLFLGKPSHVAVSQAVELVKTRAKSAAGLVNAVLRKVADAADAFMAESDAHRFGLPAWLLGRIAEERGEQAAADFGRAGLEPAPVYVANVPMWMSDKRAPMAFLEAGMPVRDCGAVPGAWRVLEPSKVATCPLIEEGQAVVADYGAQTVACLAAPQPGDRVLEVGSGRGTKTILLEGYAHREKGAARVWALDVHSYKAKLAAERLEKSRVVGVVQVTGDARDQKTYANMPAHFEQVLVDAPCSGTGTLRRHPEIAWSLTPADVSALAQLQGEILAAVADKVAVDGLLTYATCSVLREENEDVVAAFLASPAGAGFEVVPAAKVPAPGAGLVIDELAERSTPEGYFRTLPAPAACDGHFCASLRRVR
jgi:16S rRNA (cytosine967-C5)-methyltransferase